MVNRRVILVCVIVVNLYSLDGYSLSVVSSEHPAGFDSLAVAVPSFFSLAEHQKIFPTT